MADEKIECPKCGHLIPINEVLKVRLNEQVNNEVLKRLDMEKTKLEENLKKKITEEQSGQLKVLQEKLSFEEEKRRVAQKKELEFLKKQSELEDKLKSQELEIARKLQEEKKIIEEKIRKEEEERNELKIKEKDQQIEGMKKALAEAQRKGQQGSMQTQGEVLELALEDLLKQNFPIDEIKPVPKGVLGADVIHSVLSKNGQITGLIAWETKRTKAWTEEWVQKLKDDGRQMKANLCVLVSEVLPKEVNRFGFYKGIWVCDFTSIMGLTVALRQQLIAVHNIVAANVGKNEKKEILYNYFTSQTFANHVQSIFETYSNMKKDLEQEKAVFTRQWAKREMTINRLSENTAQMFGEIQGIAGELETPDMLELDSGQELGNSEQGIVDSEEKVEAVDSKIGDGIEVNDKPASNSKPKQDKPLSDQINLF